MNAIIKWVLFVLVLILLVGSYTLYTFVDRIKNGVEEYDYDPPELTIREATTAILVFTKTNAYIHKEAIKASVPALQKLCAEQGWEMYHTENGAIFNESQLSLFDVIIWNNVSGPVLTDIQQNAMIDYIEKGGGFIGIHAAGDGSHKWTWYRENIIGAEYSHHPMNPQFQEAKIHLECDTILSFPCDELSTSFDRTDEWYIFMDNPRNNGMRVLYTVDESTINPDGQFYLLQRDKKFGMGKDHPIAWYNTIKKGRSFYSAMGHTADSWIEEAHLDIIRKAILWTGQIQPKK